MVGDHESQQGQQSPQKMKQATSGAELELGIEGQKELGTCLWALGKLPCTGQNIHDSLVKN